MTDSDRSKILALAFEQPGLGRWLRLRQDAAQEPVGYLCTYDGMIHHRGIRHAGDLPLYPRRIND